MSLQTQQGVSQLPGIAEVRDREESQGLLGSGQQQGQFGVLVIDKKRDNGPKSSREALT